mgnify:FL=1
MCLIGPRFDLVPGWGALLGVSLATTLLAFDLGAVALFVGAVSGSRGAALGTASAVAAGSYVISALAPVVAAIDQVRWMSPFVWAVGDDQLTNGVTWAQVGALVALGLALIAGTVWAFRRLDVH